ncbi:predicted protein [Postia placenta Mad-698-R]|nr:predicted protein [Postia placenta Mad-698-R]
MALMQFLFVVARFSDPIGIRNLLWYMETGGEGAVVKPWVWISWLFLGPAARIIILSYYFFLSERILVRIEAILTQLVFNHALRMRIMADVSETPTFTGDTTVAGTPDTASLAESGGTRTPDNAANSEDVTLSGTNTAAGETTTTQGKDKSKVSVQQSQKDSSGPSASSEDTQTEGSNVTGKVNNLITTDLDTIAWTREIFQLGRIRGAHAEKMKKTDVRVQAVTEGSYLAVYPGDDVLNHRDTVAINAIRMIKLFGWEPRLSRQLGAKREDELTWIKTSKLLGLAIGNLKSLIAHHRFSHIIAPITMVVTYLIYYHRWLTLLTASTVFSAVTVFEMVSELSKQSFGRIPKLMRAKVSLDRMNEFLQKTELLDKFSEKQTTHALELGISSPLMSSDTLGFRNASFTWTKAPPSTPRSSKRNFTLRIDGDLTFESGHINLIVGPTGSGKTSLLMALLGEMHYIPTGPDSFVTLPRSGGVAYAAQESWVLNDTIRNNILFGATFDRERYDKVINQCGLTRDLNLFDARDHTEVGERGITLSGGQKILAALDVHTTKWIVEKCLQGDLVRGRTVLLVTHNVSLAGPIAQHIVSLGIDGRIASQGTLSNALEHDQMLAAEVAQDLELLEKAGQNIHQDRSSGDDSKRAHGKLVVSEEISEGHLGWSSYTHKAAVKLFLKSVGGGRPILYCVITLCIAFVSEFLDNLSYWYLGFWARQYEEHPPWEVNVPLWWDKTPTGRVIARCTQDIGTIDSDLYSCLDFLIILTMTMLIKLAAVTIAAPFYIIPGILLAAAGGYICQVYMKAQLSVKREKSNARAPVLGHFGAAFAGLVSIRAYGVQDAFRKESYARIDKYSRAARIFWALTHPNQTNGISWVNIRIELFGAMFSTGVAFYLVYGGGSSSASKTGFTLNMAGNSLERIQQYLEIEQEPKSTESGIPPAYWPSSGNLRVEKLSARYSADGPRVLHEISFEIKSGERVGVGETIASGEPGDSH